MKICKRCNKNIVNKLFKEREGETQEFTFNTQFKPNELCAKCEREVIKNSNN